MSTIIKAGDGTLGGETHAALPDVTADQHHARDHAIDGSTHTGTLAHTALSSVGADQHHADVHADAKHADPPILKALIDALGDLIYGSAADTVARLAGNITTTRKFLRQTGDGAASAAPAWDTLVDGDIPASIARDSELPTAGTTPSQIDIGDAQAGGSDTTFSKNDHQHALPAPTAGYPVDVAGTEADGTGTTVARADHRHAHGSGYLPDAHHAQAHNNDHATGGADAFGVADLLDAIARVTVRRNTGADVGSRRRLNLIEGANVTLTVADDAAGEEVDVTIAASGGSGYNTIENEGTPLTQRTTINFTGAGVTASDVGGETEVNIPGGAGAGVTIHEQNLGGVGTEHWQGKFVVTDASVSASSKITIAQAPGPYTGKGTLADEAEMDPLWCVAVPGSGQFTVRWRSLTGIVNTLPERKGPAQPSTAVGGMDHFPALQEHVAGLVRGNVKFMYSVA